MPSCVRNRGFSDHGADMDEQPYGRTFSCMTEATIYVHITSKT